jgi:DNA-binding NtrC family response regulator
MTQRILIIDDEVDMLMLLRMIIEDNTDFEVETTNSPTIAIKLFREEDYDLVITDLKMPGLDGMDIFDEFKGLKPEVPVISIAEFITKPFRKDSILFTIRRVLELANAKKENEELKRRLEEEKR